jgi:hypothetical protein
MVKFEFVMNAIDAQNLIDCINAARVAAMERALEYSTGQLSKTDIANKHWYEAHADYLRKLQVIVAAGSSLIDF